MDVMDASLIKKPSAFLPIAMSSAALIIVLIHITFVGIAREPDEGGAAHMWQLLMAGQAPIMAFFAIKWLPRIPGRALIVLGLQIAAAVAALAPVYFLNF